MRYKLAVIVLTLLSATPLYGQGQPITVDTFPATPTVVKTGEIFKVNYRVRYLDLAKWKEEIVLFNEDITVEGLQGKIGAPFEVMSVEIKELNPKDGEYWQDFIISFRIIDKEKGAKKIPKIGFRWTKKEAGDEKNNLETRKEVQQVESLEVHVNYVTSVPEDPYLDIRDGLKLGDFSRQAILFQYTVPGISMLFIVLWAVLLVRFIKAPKQARVVSIDATTLPVEEIEEYFVPSEAVSFKHAKKNLAQTIERIKDEISDTSKEYRGEIFLNISQDIYKDLHALLIAAVPGLNPGDTPSQIREYIKSKTQGSFLLDSTYAEMSENLVNAWNDLERHSFEGMDPKHALARISDNLEDLEHLLSNLKWHKVFFDRLSNSLSWKR